MPSRPGFRMCDNPGREGPTCRREVKWAKSMAPQCRHAAADIHDRLVTVRRSQGPRLRLRNDSILSAFCHRLSRRRGRTAPVRRKCAIPEERKSGCGRFHAYLLPRPDMPRCGPLLQRDAGAGTPRRHETRCVNLASAGRAPSGSQACPEPCRRVGPRPKGHEGALVACGDRPMYSSDEGLS